jgi:hypothetical protein
MPSPRAGGARFIHREFLYLTKEDLAEIDSALLAAFPRLRFVHRPDLIDHEATKASAAYREARQRTRWPDVPVISKPESEWKLTYYEGLHTVDEFRVGAWVEPENWLPVWEKNSRGYPGIANPPALNFDYRPSRIHSVRSKTLAGVPLPGCGPDEYQWMQEADFQGVYYPWESEQLSFLRRVRRTFDKHTTNKCVTVDFETLKPKYVSLKGAMDRIGRHAAAWAMHPRRLLGRDQTKPIEWAERYPNGWTSP